MSLVLNMVGGGGGGSLKDTDAILTVTVPTGSTVTMTKGGVTLTPTMWVQAADNTLDCALFVISPSLFDAQNPWTVTATLGTDTASYTMTIDSNKQYEVTINYHVPPEYQEVEYIYFPSGAYIDTVVNSNSGNYAVDMEIKYASVVDDMHMVGTAGDINAFFTTIYQGSYFYNNNSGVTNSGISSQTNTKTRIRYNFASLGYTFYVNSTASTAGASEATKNNSNITIGKRGNVAKLLSNLYYFYLIDNSNNSFVRKMCPCYRKSDSVAGFWDRISETFFTNAGAGSFIVGPDVN